MRKALLLVVDIQPTLLKTIHNGQGVLENSIKAVKGCKALGIPILVTEQVPNKLGPTDPSLQAALGDDYRPISKCEFGCLKNGDFFNTFDRIVEEPSEIIVCGIEAHVCVYQTVQQMLSLGHQPTLLSDCTSSRDPKNAELMIQKALAHPDMQVKSLEMLLFERLSSASHPKFKEVLSYIK